jgi:hypothetical protein
MSDEYKSLRTVIFEVQAAAAPTVVSSSKPQQKAERKTGETWKTASGHYGAKNPSGTVDYFEDEDRAKAYAKGQGRGGSADYSKVDTSREVALDGDGFAKDAAADQKPVTTQPKGNRQLQTKPQPQASQTQPQAVEPAQTKPVDQPTKTVKDEPQPEEENPQVAAEDPVTVFDSAFNEVPPGSGKMKPDIRKANVVTRAIASKAFVGPKDDGDSVFGDAKVERQFTDEMNHAALAALRGQKVVDFELCSKIFSQVGFCYDKTGKKTTKGIVRKDMPQFSSQVDPQKTDSPAFKTLMGAKGYTSPEQVTAEDLKLEVNMEKAYQQALTDAGYEINDEEVDATSLKPIQGELLGSKVAAMYGTLVAAQQDPENYGKAAARLLEPIYVSDGYVIDGHHRWAAQCAVDIANGAGTNATMRTRTITKNGKPVPIDEIIEFSNQFQQDVGLMSQSRSGGTVQNKPEAKPEAKTEEVFKSSRSRLVESLLEAVKVKRDRGPQLGTIGYGVNADDPARFVGSNKPLKARKTDAMGNLLPKPSAKGWAASERATGNAIEMAQELIAIINIKPNGTVFQIYGEKNGKPYTLKVKKIKKMGVDTFQTSSAREVELKAAGTGLQVLDKNSRKVLLDRGNDMLWD